MSVTLRAPSHISSTSASTSSSESPALIAPPLPFLTGTWHVTHSTLPMWKKARNVTITYTPLPSPTSDSSPPHLDDLVQYQSLASPKMKTVHGIDTPAGLGAWNWRGKGWLMIASSHWEILGYGEVGAEEWVVTYFQKTMFTPQGIDVYSRRKEGLSEGVLADIRRVLKDVKGMGGLEGGLFEVKRD